MSDFLDVRISSGGFVEISKNNIIKRISLSDFNDLVKGLTESSNSAPVSSKAIRTPKAMHSMSTNNNGYTVNLYFEEREGTLRHISSGIYDVYLPNVMISVSLIRVAGETDKYSLGKIYWYATDKSRSELSPEWPSGPSSRDHIWTLPMPNMFGDARMCTGGNRLPSVIYSDWTVLEMLYYDVLLRSPFNNDLSVQSVRATSNPTTWLKTLADHKADEESTGFPYNLLTNY